MEDERFQEVAFREESEQETEVDLRIPIPMQHAECSEGEENVSDLEYGLALSLDPRLERMTWDASTRRAEEAAIPDPLPSPLGVGSDPTEEGARSAG